MASFSRSLLALVMVILLMLWHDVQAQSGCTNAIISLSPCLSYVTSNTSTPTPACCLQLNNVVLTAPQCLCTLLNNNGGGGALGNININQTQALTLPNACNIQTPPLSQCNAVSNPPTDSPASSPEPTETSQDPPTDAPSPATISDPKIPSGTTSKTAPSTNNSSNGIMRKPFYFPALIFFIVALASNHVLNI